MKNIYKLIISKSVNHNKNADTPLFLMSFIKRQRKENFENIFFVPAGAQKV